MALIRSLAKFYSLFSKKILLGLGAFVILAGAGYWFFTPEEKPDESVAVTRGDIVQEVSVTGKVKSANEINLAFERGGRVDRLYVAEGDRVEIGEPLARLDQQDLNSQITEARANIDVQNAKFEELKRGSRPEEIEIARSANQKAKQDLENNYDSVPLTLIDAYVDADDAARIKTDILFSDSSPYGYALRGCDSTGEYEAHSLRNVSIQRLADWRAKVYALHSATPEASLDAALLEARSMLEFLREFLNDVDTLLTSSCALTYSSLDTPRASIATARTNLSAALSSVTSLDQTIASQKLTAKKAEDELNLKLAGNAPEVISAQEAVVRQTEAKLKTLLVELDKTSINSPLEGIVTMVNVTAGEIVAGNATVISLISDANLQIEANVPEADIAKIQLGQTGKATLDAYGNDKIFGIKVVRVNPAETVIDGVPTYLTVMEFAASTTEAKSGMTANIDISTAMRKNVIFIPSRLIINRGGKKMVLVKTNTETPEERLVETGLRGSDANMEIISGLSEGERVLPPTISD